MAATTFAPARPLSFVSLQPAPSAGIVPRPGTPGPATTPGSSGSPLATPDDAHGARAIEVAAMFGDTVLGVKHCVNPRGGKVTRATWGFAAGGLASLIASASAFGSALHTQTINAATYAHAAAMKIPAWSIRPEQVAIGTSVVAFGGLALAIGALATALARKRREQQTPTYRIGTAPGVEQPVDGAPTADFAMIAPAGDDFVFNFGAGMDGDLTVGDSTLTLAALVASGQARPSQHIAGALELPIPRAARIRTRAGQTSFLVSSMAAPRAVGSPLTSGLPLMRGLESRVVKYIAGSLAVHLGIWAVLQQVPVEDSGGAMDLSSVEDTSTRTATVGLDDPLAPPPEVAATDGAAGSDGGGAAMDLPSGTAGAPDASSAGRTHIAASDSLPPQLARAQAIEAATTAGVLGSTLALETAIHSLTGTGDISVGFDADSSYNGLVDGIGTARGNFGLGVSGGGPGGGCGLADCRGIGTGRYATIGNGIHTDGNFGGGPGHGDPMHRRVAAIPTKLGEPVAVCGSSGDCFDKSIIRRYIKRSIAKIQYCYEHELLGSPELSGTVTVQFLVAADGTVQQSAGSGMTPAVSSCVAGVVKNIAFPRPNTGGAVQVNYPFTFRQAGH